MLKEIGVSTKQKHDAVDITADVNAVVVASGAKEGVCCVYSPHTTCGIIVNENHDPNVMADILHSLESTVPAGKWLHDRVDHNADAHIKVALVGSSECIPIHKEKLFLGTWQSIMVLEFDGPRKRKVVVTIIKNG